MASNMARIALGHVAKEYPNKLDHVLRSRRRRASAARASPDLLRKLRLAQLRPRLVDVADAAAAVPPDRGSGCDRRLVNETFTSEKVAAELAYLDRPLSRGFERPYGWAWLLYLHLEAIAPSRKVGADLEALARAFAQRLRDYLSILTYPIRVGTHFNTAFALILSLEWAEQFDAGLAEQIRERSRHWFGADRDCQAWEPGGDEFLSPALIEALCMARAHEALFPSWFEQFLPRLAARQPATLFAPAIVSDRSDGKIAHLDGLNLSRAWCWRSLPRC